MRAMASSVANHEIAAGPLRVLVDATGELRIGWDEPDWLGPARLVAGTEPTAAEVTGNTNEVDIDTAWVRARVRALAGEPVAVLRLEALTAGDASSADG